MNLIFLAIARPVIRFLTSELSLPLYRLDKLENKAVQKGIGAAA
jgi:hypothetical protein